MKSSEKDRKIICTIKKGDKLLFSLRIERKKQMNLKINAIEWKYPDLE